MEAIVLLGLVTSLAAASMRWGYDSRETIRSKEQELASYGVTWEELSAVWDLDAVLQEVQAVLSQR